MKKITTIKPDGTTEVIEQDKAPSLEQLQKLCGGYIQIIPGFTKHEGVNCEVYADEDGKPKGQPVNETATRLWFEALGGGVYDDVLVGNIVIVSNA